MRFQYFEIRPCVDFGDHISSYTGAPEFHEGIGGDVCTPQGALAEAEQARAAAGIEKPVFWTLYGRDTDDLAMAIGDFTTFGVAYEIMNAILAPMAAARDVLDVGTALRANHADLVHRMEGAGASLEDFINQCSNGERI